MIETATANGFTELRVVGRAIQQGDETIFAPDGQHFVVAVDDSGLEYILQLGERDGTLDC